MNQTKALDGIASEKGEGEDANTIEETISGMKERTRLIMTYILRIAFLGSAASETGISKELLLRSVKTRIVQGGYRGHDFRKIGPAYNATVRLGLVSERDGMVEMDLERDLERARPYL